MKVLHVLNELKFSGAEIMYVDAAPVFQKKGAQLFVLGTASDIGEFADHFKNAGYNILHKPLPPLRNYFKRIKYYREIIKFIKDEDIDVVHIHSNPTMWGMALCAHIAGRKSVYTFHNVFKSNWYSHLYHYALRESAKKIFKCKFHTIGESVYNNELKRYKNNSIKIENWYGSNRLYPALMEEKEEIRRSLNISKNTFVLISIGGCSHTKRHYDIINAMPLIMKEIPNLLYIHLGTGETEQYEKDLVEQLNLLDNVRFYGNQQNVRNFLVASDVYLMPSKNEGLPITTIETMGCQIPTILYDVPGLRDFNHTGLNSFLIPEDYKVLANKVIYLFNNPKEGAVVATNAKRMVDEIYNMEKNASKVFELYK